MILLIIMCLIESVGILGMVYKNINNNFAKWYKSICQRFRVIILLHFSIIYLPITIAIFSINFKDFNYFKDEYRDITGDIYFEYTATGKISEVSLKEIDRYNAELAECQSKIGNPWIGFSYKDDLLSCEFINVKELEQSFVKSQNT